MRSNKILTSALVGLVLFGILVQTIISCKNYSDIPYTYAVPEQIEDGLAVGNLETANIDQTLINQAIKRIKGGALGQIHSVLIYQNDKLILEEYFPGNEYNWEAPGFSGEYVNWDKDMTHKIMSDTKSVTSACVGIALDKGFIESVDQSIFDYLPDHQHFKKDGKEAITIEHLLTMTSGLHWTEWNFNLNNPENPIIALWFSDMDPVTHILNGTMENEPGSSFTYYGGSQILLGEIIRITSGKDIEEFAMEYLFNPMEVDTIDWSLKFNNGVIEAGGGLRLRPRDMLKFGILYLNDGKWNDKQIISKSWIDKSTRVYGNNRGIKVPGEDSGKVEYGYSWWLKTFEINGVDIPMFWAIGWGGQKIIVIPDLEAVIVFTGGNYTGGNDQFDLINNYIIPAMEQI